MNTRLSQASNARSKRLTPVRPSFGGEVLSPEILRDSARHGEIDLPAFWERNSKPTRTPEIVACAQALRGMYTRLGAIGFCFGGWAVFRLGSKSHPSPLVDCISTAHPAKLEDDEMQEVGVPVQIMAAEHDELFEADRRDAANGIIPRRGVAMTISIFQVRSMGLRREGTWVIRRKWKR